MAGRPASPETAKVDFLVDENGSRIELPHENEGIRGARDSESTIGGTGPTNWWRLGLVLLGLIALVLLVLQLVNGGARTDVVPGTPVTPAATAPAQPAQ
jgi:hypothetical protein